MIKQGRHTAKSFCSEKFFVKVSALIRLKYGMSFVRNLTHFMIKGHVFFVFIVNELFLLVTFQTFSLWIAL
jgi:hypothetical protein